MAEITLQTFDIDGAELVLTRAAANGDTFANDGNTVLVVVNGSGANCEVTLTSQIAAAHPGEAVANKVVDVPAGETWMIGPINQAAFNNSSGQVEVGYESLTTISVAACKLTN